ATRAGGGGVLGWLGCGVCPRAGGAGGRGGVPSAVAGGGGGAGRGPGRRARAAPGGGASRPPLAGRPAAAARAGRRGVGAARAGASPVSLTEALSRAEILSLHAPLLPSTRLMLGAEELALLPDGATVINTARGGLVDHEALLRECASGRIDAILDVTDPEPLPRDHPLVSLPNVTITPHIAGSLGNETHRLARFAIDALAAHAAGQELPGMLSLDASQARAWDQTSPRRYTTVRTSPASPTGYCLLCGRTARPVMPASPCPAHPADTAQPSTAWRGSPARSCSPASGLPENRVPIGSATPSGTRAGS